MAFNDLPLIGLGEGCQRQGRRIVAPVRHPHELHGLTAQLKGGDIADHAVHPPGNRQIAPDLAAQQRLAGPACQIDVLHGCKDGQAVIGVLTTRDAHRFKRGTRQGQIEVPIVLPGAAARRVRAGLIGHLITQRVRKIPGARGQQCAGRIGQLARLQVHIMLPGKFLLLLEQIGGGRWRMLGKGLRVPCRPTAAGVVLPGRDDMRDLARCRVNSNKSPATIEAALASIEGLIRTLVHRVPNDDRNSAATPIAWPGKHFLADSDPIAGREIVMHRIGQRHLERVPIQKGTCLRSVYRPVVIKENIRIRLVFQKIKPIGPIIVVRILGGLL